MSGVRLALIGLLLSGAAACGVKGPPRPPEAPLATTSSVAAPR